MVVAVLLVVLAVSSWQSSQDAARRRTIVGNRIAVSTGDEPTYAEQGNPTGPLLELVAAAGVLAWGVSNIRRGTAA